MTTTVEISYSGLTKDYVRIIGLYTFYNNLGSGTGLSVRRRAPLYIKWLFFKTVQDEGWTYQHNSAQLAVQQKYRGRIAIHTQDMTEEESTTGAGDIKSCGPQMLSCIDNYACSPPQGLQNYFGCVNSVDQQTYVLSSFGPNSPLADETGQNPQMRWGDLPETILPSPGNGLAAGTSQSVTIGMTPDWLQNHHDTGHEIYKSFNVNAETQYDMIVGTSFRQQHDMTMMAHLHPLKFFLHCGGDMYPRKNMVMGFGKVYQGRYLSGILAASYLVNLRDTGGNALNPVEKFSNLKVGYVAAMPVPETIRMVNAVKRGLNMVDPSIDLLVMWLGTWGQKKLERLTAHSLIKHMGVHCIFQHVDHDVPQRVAQSYSSRQNAENAWDFEVVSVGYHSDMGKKVGGNTVLTSVLTEWESIYDEAINARLKQHKKAREMNPQDGENYIYKLAENNYMNELAYTDMWRGNTADGYMGYSLGSVSSRMSPSVQQLFLSEKLKIDNGEDLVFCGPTIMDCGHSLFGPAPDTATGCTLMTDSVNKPETTVQRYANTCLLETSFKNSMEYRFPGVVKDCAPYWGYKRPDGMTLANFVAGVAGGSIQPELKDAIPMTTIF